MRISWLSARKQRPPQTRGVLVTQAVFRGKAIVTCCVGLVQFIWAPVVGRSPWGTFWAFEPRWFGLVLIMWGGTDLIWRSWLQYRMRRAWWYCIVSSVAAVPASFVALTTSAMPYPGLIPVLGVLSAIAAVFLLVFASEFDVHV
jgi:hypothetical protein